MRVSANESGAVNDRVPVDQTGKPTIVDKISEVLVASLVVGNEASGN